MYPTYSFDEILVLIRSLDIDSTPVLAMLVEEEKSFFAFYECNAIRRMIAIMNRRSVSNEVRTEFLLSFN